MTYDEPLHFKYGLNVLNGNTDRIEDSKMPVTALNALPLKLAGVSDIKSEKEYWNRVKNGRYVTILCSALLGILVFVWSRQLYGFAAGLLSLVLYCFDPNVQAHARWMTTDLYAALAVTLALYCFWRFLNRGGTWLALLSALTLGLAQLAKFSAIYLYPVFIVIALLRWTRHRPRLIRSASTLIVFALVNLAVINAGYLFNRTGQSLGEYEFRSELFRNIQARAGSPLRQVGLPLPAPFVEGLDWVKYNEVSGEFRGPTYLWGKTQKEPFGAYYPVAFLYKVPIAAQLIMLMAILHVVLKRRRFRFLRNELLLAAPMIFYAVYFTFFCAAQLGIRLMLPVFPLMHVFCGSLFKIRIANRPVRALAGGLVVYLVISMMSYYPHYLSYFNELVLDRKNAYRILADSNLEWGQNDWYMLQYLEDHPSTVLNPPEPIQGRMLVSVNILTGILQPDDYTWLAWVRQNLEPVDHVAYSYLVYDVPPYRPF